MTETSEDQVRETEPAGAVAESAPPGDAKRAPRARGLLLIGLFKLAKALFFIAVGAGALQLVHKNLGDVFLRVATWLHFDLAGKFVEMMEDRADLISGHQLRQLSLGTFGYAALSLVEGVGLMMEQTWAEYLTLTLTIGALPWDGWELIKHPTPIRAGLVLINLAVLAYLLWFVRWHRRQKHGASAP